MIHSDTPAVEAYIMDLTQQIATHGNDAEQREAARLLNFYVITPNPDVQKQAGDLIEAQYNKMLQRLGQ